METVTDRRLLVDERLRRILQLLEERGRVTVRELVREFGVTTVTVRSDLDALAGLGSLQRSHGGAVRLLETACLLYTSPSPRDGLLSRMPSSA